MSQEFSAITFDFSKLDPFIRGVRLDIVDRVVGMVANYLSPQVVKEAPWKEGALKKNVSRGERTSPLYWIISIGVNYWRPVQFGSKAHIIEAKNKSYLVFQTADGWVRAKKVNHPGTKANPFITRAIDKTSPMIPDFVEKVIQEFISK